MSVVLRLHNRQAIKHPDKAVLALSRNRYKMQRTPPKVVLKTKKVHFLVGANPSLIKNRCH